MLDEPDELADVAPAVSPVSPVPTMTNADVKPEWVTTVTTSPEYKDLYAVFKRHNLVPDADTDAGKAITKLLYKCKTQEIFFKAGHNAERNREYLAQSL